MKVNVSFYNQTKEDVDVFKDLIRDVLGKAAELEGIGKRVGCSYIFINNEQMKQLNAGYRGKDGVTDVLTFGSDEVKYAGTKHLGDVFISLDQMREQSYAYGHGEVREMAFLAVHGFLHLLGYDHLTDEEEKVMFSKQEAILDAKNIRR